MVEQKSGVVERSTHDLALWAQAKQLTELHRLINPGHTSVQEVYDSLLVLKHSADTDVYERPALLHKKAHRQT